ncbi:hypothetical protein KY284_020052 [Solanum tuberosum]|nr:hypothetical protein KY284_020052 [Solanum tuberosum]
MDSGLIANNLSTSEVEVRSRLCDAGELLDWVLSRILTHFDVDTFVEEVLVKDGEWLPGNPEALTGWYIFVCCHGSRDPQCGVCGPAIVSRLWMK